MACDHCDAMSAQVEALATELEKIAGHDDDPPDNREKRKRAHATAVLLRHGISRMLRETRDPLRTVAIIVGFISDMVTFPVVMSIEEAKAATAMGNAEELTDEDLLNLDADQLPKA